MTSLRATILAVSLVLAACSAPADSGQFPGPVPENVVFAEPAADVPAAPEFDLELLDGRTLEIAEHWDERPVVLVFFETWCTRCIEQQNEINDVVAEYRDTVLFVGLAGLSEVDDVHAYVSEHQVPYPVGIDAEGEIWLRYAVAEPPLVALISKDGRLLRGWPQGVTGDELRAQIAALVVESP